jgi:ABC-type transport system involved in multi-copper enzyme maturation permease subunit
VNRVLLAEWTKLRTVPRWMLTLGAAAVLTVLVAVLNTAGISVSGGGGGGEGAADVRPDVTDAGTFRYQDLPGDGSIVAHVVRQTDSHEWAKAGLLVRTGGDRGGPYAAIMVTPDHGVHLQSGFGDTDVGGGSARAPRWLRLDRSGTAVTGYESADGTDWRRVGSVELGELTGTARLGLFVASPEEVHIVRDYGSESMSSHPTDGTATFAGVRADPHAPWHDDVRMPPPGPASVTGADGSVTLTGGGDIGPDRFAEDRTVQLLNGVLLGLVAVVALGVLFVTAEYRRGTILATFAASPRRGRVLAAKALVLGAATFAAGLVAAFTSFLVGSAIAAGKGLAMPSLADPGVLRAVLGTAALLAVVAVFALGVATIVRRSTPAITVVLLLLVVPHIVATGLPLGVAAWVQRLTPAAGFAIQDTVERFDTAIAPWAGFGVLCAYAAAALAVAAWRLDRRDA